jgi:hypothetical protein
MDRHYESINYPERVFYMFLIPRLFLFYNLSITHRTIMLQTLSLLVYQGF